MRQFDYNKYLKSNPLLKEAKNAKKDGDETWFSDVNYFKKEHEGYKLKPTDMVAVGDSKAMTYAQAVKKFASKINEDINEITQEDVFEILKQMGAKIDALHAQFIQMKQDLQSGDRSITASRVLDTAIKTFEEVDAISDAATAFGETKKPMKEDMALVGNIALGVVGGLAGLYALVKTTKFLGYVAGQGLMALGNKLQSSAKTAARGRRKELIMGIIKKFEGDTELQSMYAALPPYTPKTKNERNNQMRKIAAYIKSKLSPEEMDYFADISSMLRTGDLAETKKPMKEYNKDSGPQMEELLKILKDLQEKNKEIKAVGVRTLEKMIADLEMEIRRLPNMDKNVSQYNND